MSSQFTAQSMSNYLNAVASRNTEDQDFTDAQKTIENLIEEKRQQGIELLATSALPAVHLIKSVYTKVNKLAETAQNFKDKVETAGKQIQSKVEGATENVSGEAEGMLSKAKSMLGNKVEEISDNVVDKIKSTAGNKIGGLVEEAKSQGASLEAEPVETLGSMLENSRLGNLYKRFKNVTTSGEKRAKTLQESQFEQDPEAGFEQARIEQPLPAETNAKVPQAPPEEGPKAPVEGEPAVEGGAEAGAEAGEDVAKTTGENVAKEAGAEAGEKVAGEAAAEGVGSLIPGVGEVLDVGLLLWQGIEGIKDLFDKPHEPVQVNEPTPSFQAGI
jgi:hypothetical protein